MPIADHVVAAGAVEDVAGRVARVAPPIAPAMPPMPTAEPTARRGNMSEVMVKRLADQPWCAAVARPIRPTAAQRLVACERRRSG